MLRRSASALVILWILGFVWFAVSLPQPLGDGQSDAAVVFTGGEGRVARGLAAVTEGKAKRLLIAGVDPEVTAGEFAAEYSVAPQAMRCCVTLEQESVDTRTNATQSAQWIAANKVRSVRLVTSDWHMRRAAFELDMAAPAGTAIVRDAVPTKPSFRILFLEYHKLVARWVSRLWDR
jgi:uncharacterized SAM-binding protein YcdF (DUF218 family)